MHLQCQKILQPTLSQCLNVLMHRNIKVGVRKKVEKKKKRKYQLKYIYVENDERDNYYQQNCAKRKC